jgi:hypothetical protein
MKKSVNWISLKFKTFFLYKIEENIWKTHVQQRTYICIQFLKNLFMYVFSIIIIFSWY